eukprot:CAMPEP_0177650238 /NCGR_PEP_ID=MMETSP0447-20121125/11830_1 /TAXON_ID=0 /ORGANISM="Stygamoeba regulata, Strain BSH-02190019" /LENGTH=709 /DNA_ID=CAMNT_0019153083 /DNA_START=164 /DNA_END=2296 /DNA_ORIENTATION=+
MADPRAQQSRNTPARKKKPEYAECPICLRKYMTTERSSKQATGGAQEKDRRPRVFACGHSVCSACLDHWRGSHAGEAFSCPTCRKEYNVGDKIALNYDLMNSIAANANNLIRLSPRAVTTTRRCSVTPRSDLARQECARCVKKGFDPMRPPTSRCLDCDLLFCDECDEEVHLVGAAAAHERVDVDDFTPALPCAERGHHGTPTLLVCTEHGCEAQGAFVCSYCEKSGAHKGHATRLVHEVAEEQESLLEPVLDSLRQRCATVQAAAVAVQETLVRVTGGGGGGGGGGGEDDHQYAGNQGSAAVARLAIEQSFDIIVAALRARQRELLEELAAQERTKVADLQEQLEDLAGVFSVLYGLVANGEHLQRLAKDHQRLFVASFADLAHRIETKSRITACLETVHSERFELSLSPEAEELLDAARTIGEVGVVPAVEQAPVSMFQRVFRVSHGVVRAKCKRVRTIPLKMNRPAFIAFLGSDQMAVSSYTAKEVVLFRPDGTLLRRVGALSYPMGMYYDERAAELLVVLHGGSEVRVLDSEGRRTRSMPVANGRHITPNTTGNYLVSTSGHLVHEVGTAGVLRSFSVTPPGSTGSHSACQMAISSRTGLLYVADYSGGCVSVFDANFTFQRSITSPHLKGNVSGLVLDDTDRMFVGTSAGVHMFSPEGVWERQLTTRAGTNEGQSCVGLPASLALHKNELYVCDCVNNQVYVFA